MKSLGNEKVIKIGGKKLTVKQLKLRKTIALLRSIGDLPKEVTGIFEQDVEVIIAQLPLHIANLLPTMGKFIVQAVDVDWFTEEYLFDELTLEEAVEVVLAIVEVNNIAQLVEKSKKVIAMSRKQ